MASDLQKQLLSSVIFDIKNYQGSDPLRPWIQGIRKMKQCLPPPVLKENLPRFLQKCAEAFESDRRYRNDSRYLRIWIELMDFVDDAKLVLRRMEKNQIGLKRATFYSAYALYYEKRKKFEDAEKMYYLGVRNLAEPVEELHKLYEQFIRRMELYKKRRAKSTICKRTKPTYGSMSFHEGFEHLSSTEECLNSIKEGGKVSEKLINAMKENSDFSISGSDSNLKGANSLDAKLICQPDRTKDDCGSSCRAERLLTHLKNVDTDLEKQNSSQGDDTVVVKFVGSAIVGKSEAEDACHHGLVDPTVNMKEAMSAISNMFREPLELEPMARRKSHQSKPRPKQQDDKFEVFIDENLDGEENMVAQNSKRSKKQIENEMLKPFVEAFSILTDNDGDEECLGGGSVELEKQMQTACSVFDTKQIGRKPIISDNRQTTCLEDVRLKEDTVIQRFVGSTIFGEPKVENACHHGLVDPTVNLKEAIDDINSMFIQPLNIFKANKLKKIDKFLDRETVDQGFIILADDDLDEGLKGIDSCGISPKFSEALKILDANKPREHRKLLDRKPAAQCFTILADDDLDQCPRGQGSSNIPCKFSDNDLFEPTLCTKEIIADINEMFGRPLDF